MKFEFKIIMTKEDINNWNEFDEFENEEEILENIHDCIINDIREYIQNADVEMIIED